MSYENIERLLAARQKVEIEQQVRRVAVGMLRGVLELKMEHAKKVAILANALKQHRDKKKLFESNENLGTW